LYGQQPTCLSDIRVQGTGIYDVLQFFYVVQTRPVLHMYNNVLCNLRPVLRLSTKVAGEAREAYTRLVVLSSCSFSLTSFYSFTYSPFTTTHSHTLTHSLTHSPCSPPTGAPPPTTVSSKKTTSTSTTVSKSSVTTSCNEKLVRLVYLECREGTRYVTVIYCVIYICNCNSTSLLLSVVVSAQRCVICL
jgi:hypothetical protein